MSFTTELGSLVTKWFRAVTSRGTILTDRAASSRIVAMIAAEERARNTFRKRHGMLRKVDSGEVGGGHLHDLDYSDEDDVVDKNGMVSFAGVEDDDVNVEELKRILRQGRQAAKMASEDGLKEAKMGVGDTEPLFDNILSSIGDRVEKREVGSAEKLTGETHSLMLLVYKQMQELMKKVEDLEMRAARQDETHGRGRGSLGGLGAPQTVPQQSDVNRL